MSIANSLAGKRRWNKISSEEYEAFCNKRRVQMIGKNFSLAARKAYVKKYKGKKRDPYIGIRTREENFKQNRVKYFFTVNAIKNRIKNLRRGEKHWKFNGGYTIRDYGALFNKRIKLAVKERDCFKCRMCGVSKDKLKKGSLIVHHIDFNKRNNSINNLVSLCRTCHLKLHMNDKISVRFSSVLAIQE